MLKKPFDNIKGQPTLLGYGCMRFPKAVPGKENVDYAEAEKLIDYAYENGVNYYDTAYVYHEGDSEKFIGQALKKYPRESFYLATKLPGWFVKEEADVERLFNEQLERCQVDYFDFYLCHALNKDAFKIYEELGIFEMLNEKKKNGQIRNLGFSFHDTPDVLEYILEQHPWDFVQIQLNYIDWERQDAKKQYELIEAKGIPCIVMEPVRGGALANLCPEAVEILKADSPDASVASWAIRYAASFPNVITVLSGMSTMEQVIDNVETINNFKPLSVAEQTILEDAKNKYLENTLIPCTGCRYCMDCPAGVDIPKMFHIYNEYTIGKWAPGFLEQYNKLDQQNAASCVNCKACEEHCPQFIKIPDQMESITKHVAELV